MTNKKKFDLNSAMSDFQKITDFDNLSCLCVMYDKDTYNCIMSFQGKVEHITEAMFALNNESNNERTFSLAYSSMLNSIMACAATDPKRLGELRKILFNYGYKLVKNREVNSDYGKIKTAPKSGKAQIISINPLEDM